MQELLYTSAPRGLKPGSRGFCTVLSTQGMAAPLANALEGLSGYRPVFPAGDPRAASNPVVYSHLRLHSAGKAWHVLSRVADYGLDYSQRSNKLAHHVVLDERELSPGGPAALLESPGFLRTEWQGEPRIVPSRSAPRVSQPPITLCRAWQDLTGDAGWAGVVAESFLADPDRLVLLLFEPGQELLPLFAESLALLPPEARWKVTFSTYFTGLASGTTCLWRGMPADAKEARDSLRFVTALRLDLTAGSLGCATGGALVDAARGERVPATADPGTIEFAATEFTGNEFTPPESVTFEAAGEKDLNVVMLEPASGGEPQPPFPPQTGSEPIRLVRQAPAPPPRRGASAAGRRSLADVYAEEARRPKPWKWVLLVLLLLSVGTSIAIAVGILGSPPRSPNKAMEGTQTADTAIQPDPAGMAGGEKPVETLGIAAPSDGKHASDREHKPNSPTAAENTTAVGEAGPSREEHAESGRDTSEVPTAVAEVPRHTHPETRIGEVKRTLDIRSVHIDSKQTGRVSIWKSAASGPLGGKMEVTFLRPSWVKLTAAAALNGDPNFNTSLQISKGQNPTCATITTIVAENRPELFLEIVDRSQAEGLPWCALRVRTNDAESIISFVNPADSFKLGAGKSAANTRVAFLDLPMAGLSKEGIPVSVEQLSIRIGDTSFKFEQQGNGPSREVELASTELDAKLVSLGDRLRVSDSKVERLRIKVRTDAETLGGRETLKITLWSLKHTKVSDQFNSAMTSMLKEAIKPEQMTKNTSIDAELSKAQARVNMAQQMKIADSQAEAKLQELKKLKDHDTEIKTFFDASTKYAVASALISYEVRGEMTSIGKVILVNVSEGAPAKSGVVNSGGVVKEIKQ